MLPALTGVESEGLNMKQIILLAALVGLGSLPLAASGRNSVSGSYVEARTAEVFAGGCIMASEAETTGREALLAWKVNRGSFNGTALDGLSVVAAVAGDRNLGIYEIGGGKASVRAAVFVDERANAAQRLALVAMASELSKGAIGRIVSVSPTPIRFADTGDAIDVAAGPAGQVALNVNKHMTHDPGCGAQQWFHPLSSLDEATMGLTEENTFSGSGLGTKWSDPDKRSSFFGTFSY
jgi:hypothetical protein